MNGDMVFTGATLEEALRSARSVLGDNFEYEVIEERKGILGRLVKIRAWRPSPAMVASKLIRAILDAAGKDGQVFVSEEDDVLKIRIEGGDLAGFIGKHGSFIDPFEHFIDKVLRMRFDRPVRIDLDIMGYKERRTEKLKEMIDRIISKMEKEGRRSYRLSPMPRWERRIVHRLIQQHYPAYSTKSFGEEPRRRIEIRRVG